MIYKGRKVLITVHLYEDQLERLKKLSEKNEVPRAVYIREGIDFVLDKHEKKKPRKEVMNHNTQSQTNGGE